MTIHTIIRAGNPLLKAKAEKINDFSDNDLKTLIKDLFNTQHFTQGVGISAPQIGISKSVLVYGFEKSERYPKMSPIPATIMINPKILKMSDEKVEWYEGCLSLTDLRGLVPRAASIEVAWQDQNGSGHQETITGFEARIIQHEVDHLQGILFPERMKEMRSFGFFEELRKVGLI
ncbi:MAG TPA: peptide deformylase [Gammaproteobacteria bacterium]|nr:peptide deformylase [Gammaproteobacteria bacterium]